MHICQKKSLLYKHIPYTLKHLYKQVHTFPGLWFIGNLRLDMLYTCMCNIFRANVDVMYKKELYDYHTVILIHCVLFLFVPPETLLLT